MKSILTALTATALLLLFAGCSTLDKLGDNPIMVRVAVSQAVLRYIESTPSPAAMSERKSDLVAVLSKTLKFIDADAEVTADQVLRHFIGLIDVESLSVADRLLLFEAVSLVQQSLNTRISSGELLADTRLQLRSIVQHAIDAANYL